MNELPLIPRQRKWKDGSPNFSFQLQAVIARVASAILSGFTFE
jgi:hypothetical protein